MNKFTVSAFIISVLLFSPFVYFWFRDVKPLSDEVISDQCAPYDLNVQEDRFTIEMSWKTRKECVSYLKYSLNASGSTWMTVLGENDLDLRTDHKARITDLKPNTNYFIGVVSDGKMYGENGSMIKLRTTD